MFYATKTFLSETIVALLDDSKCPLTFYWIRAEDINLGDIYLGRVAKKMPQLNGYFIEIDYKRSLFLSSKRTFEVGQLLYVIVSKEERLGKIAQCKYYPTAMSTTQIGLVKKGDILPGITESKKYTQTDWNEEFDDILSDSFDTEVCFADGARLYFEQTHAFYSIDVDSAKSTKSLDSLNILAATKIAQEIVRRNLSGNILIDFIGKKQKSTLTTLENILSDELSKSPVPYRIIGVSPIGNVEIRRDRMRMSTQDANRTLSAVSYKLFKEILKQPTHIKSVQVSLEIYELLNGLLNKTWKSVQAKTGKDISLSASTNLSTFLVEYT